MGREVRQCQGKTVIGPEEDEHKLLMHFEATGWSDYPFELELDGKSVKYKDVLERFGQEETDAAMSRAYEDGEFSD